MATRKQIRSNRKNAKKSTGPTTPKGKSIVTSNAIKHGLHAKDIVINSPVLQETESDYQYLLASLISELKPTSVFQESLVIKITNCLWRSRRAIIAETAQINRQLDYVGPVRHFEKPTDSIEFDNNFDTSTEDEIEEENYEIDRKHSNLVGIKSIPEEHFGINLLRYEMRLDRQLSRAYTLLRHLQLMDATKSLVDHQPENKNMQNKPNSPQPDES